MKRALTQIKPRRCPTRLGWVLIVGLAGASCAGLGTQLYSFLAPNTPPHTGLLVIEGWIHDDALAEAVQIYRAGNYVNMVCTGVPFETGSYLLEFKSYPEMTTARLLKLGIAPEKIITTIGEKTNQDRTYSAALALRDRLTDPALANPNIHLITIGPHGRRSRLLFQKALGKDYHVGITSLVDASYEPARWYAYSQGVRAVISETIAYTYAKFFFHP